MQTTDFYAKISFVLQVLAIEFITLAIEFVHLAIKFVPLAIELLLWHEKFVQCSSYVLILTVVNNCLEGNNSSSTASSTAFATVLHH